MQEKKNDKKRTAGLLSLRTYLRKLRILFKFWLIAALIVALLCFGINLGMNIIDGSVSTSLNFSFSGIESGLDPEGNKFDANDIKSHEIIQESLDELGLKDCDAEKIEKLITIDGIVPSNVINRITEYTPLLNPNDTESVQSIDTSKTVQETSYYPTQYKMSIKYSRAGLRKKDAANLLNKITEKYSTVFYNEYGYNTSLETAVRSIDYNEYDYIDAVDVLNSSLLSLKKYINELESGDNTRFRAENGNTFADISSSIDTICNEDLDWISSYIVLNNVTKDKTTRITNYKFKIQNLKRQKIISEETIKALTDTISNYEKNSIMIFSNATSGSNATVNQSSDTYDKLISQRIAAQTTLSSCEQNIKLYEERIQKLEKGNTKQSDIDVVENELKKISSKIDVLLKTANETASEYYEEVLLVNAYTIISPVSSSLLSTTIKESINESEHAIITYELIIAAAYLIAAVVFSFVTLPEFKGFKFRKKAGKKK